MSVINNSREEHDFGSLSRQREHLRLPGVVRRPLCSLKSASLAPRPRSQTVGKRWCQSGSITPPNGGWQAHFTTGIQHHFWPPNRRLRIMRIALLCNFRKDLEFCILVESYVDSRSQNVCSFFSFCKSFRQVNELAWGILR